RGQRTSHMEEIAAVIDGWNHARWGVVIGGASRFFNGFKNLQQPGVNARLCWYRELRPVVQVRI
ncbi:TPA: hypothetical protein JS492_004867, partial [Escherichia coli]|nr:hypothetical protein [Escherichia coli]HAY3808384.1 hypothetical protein [Escherichia coli]